jgi:hypothetical protein
VEADNLRARREQEFKLNSIGDEIHASRLEDAKAEMDALPKVDTIKGGSAVEMILLQKKVAAYLSYVNFIPGSTINKADTRGKGEGAKINHLRKFERGARKSLATLTKSVNGLADTKEMNDGQVECIKAELEEIIKENFPKTYEAVYNGCNNNIVPDDFSNMQNEDSDEEYVLDE